MIRIMYDVQYTLYIRQYTMYDVVIFTSCAYRSAYRIVYSAYRIVYSAYRIVYSAYRIVYSAYRIVYSAYFIPYNVKCTLK